MTRPTIGLLLTLALSLLVASLAAEAQPPVTIPRVGGLRPKPSSPTPSSRWKRRRKGLYP